MHLSLEHPGLTKVCYFAYNSDVNGVSTEKERSRDGEGKIFSDSSDAIRKSNFFFFKTTS
jgi:hypothetical protein